MRLLFRILTWPIRCLWRATAPSKFPHGKPFDMQAPCVIDGDTLVHNGQRIRIWGIDAPELTQLQGFAAKEQLQKLCQRRHIHVIPVDTDFYGRTVAQLFCGRGDIGGDMVETGYALSRAPLYAKKEHTARTAKAGLWRYGKIADPALHRRAERRALA